MRKWRIAPGIRFKRWDRTDARGQVRAYLVKIDPEVPGVTIDYASGAARARPRASHRPAPP